MLTCLRMHHNNFMYFPSGINMQELNQVSVDHRIGESLTFDLSTWHNGKHMVNDMTDIAL